MFAIAWYLVTLVFFSCLDVKKDAYLLPEMAAQALIVADTLAIMCAVWSRRRPNYEISVVLAAGQCAIGIGFAAGLMYSLWRINAGAVGLIVCAIALIVALFTIRPIARNQPKRWLMWQFAAYALILISMQGFYGPASDNQRSPRQFAAAMREYLQTTDVPLLVTRLPEEASFYLPFGLRDDPNASRVLILVDKGRRDPPVDARRLSDLANGATIRGFQRVRLNADDGGDRYQLFDVIVDRTRA